MGRHRQGLLVQTVRALRLEFRVALSAMLCHSRYLPDSFRSAWIRLVIDRTGLSGRYDIRLEWTPDVGENPADPGGIAWSASANPSHPSSFVAIQEQLGLKLESSKGPVEVLVIDHVEKPTAN